MRQKVLRDKQSKRSVLREEGLHGELLGGTYEALSSLGRCARRISKDNPKVAVGKTIGALERKGTDGFLQLQTHYLFEKYFCLPARGNEKGVVEGIVPYARANFLVPVPQVRGDVPRIVEI